MGLRAFLFSADGTATSELCQILTDLGIEAEICSEMLVAVERITKQSFDALIVDWDHQTDAIFLLKSVRDLKSSAHLLTLAMVKNDADLPEALQAGANSAIRKPIDPHQAHDTLSTARHLIEARHQEHKDKEVRTISALLPPGPVEADLYGHEDENKEEKSGFLEQTAPRSALEASESVASSEPPAAPEPEAEASPAADPQIRARAMAILGYGPKPADAPKPLSRRPAPKVIDFSGNGSRAPHDSAGVFSSALDSSSVELLGEVSGQRPRYGLYAFVAALLVGAVLWAFAPGDAYLARLKHFELKHSRPKSPAPEIKTDAQPKSEALVVTPAKPAAIEPDPEIASSQEDAASAVQVIENKPVPPAGAQEPPSPDPEPNLARGQSPNAARAGQEAAVADSRPNAASVAQPTIQSISAPSSLPPAGGAPSLPAPSVPGAMPAVQAPPVQPALPATHVPDEGFSVKPENRSGVLIPDSLKAAPAPVPASNLEPPTVPEESSRGYVVKRVDPQYPPIAVQQRIDGPVVLQVIVGKDGNIRDIKLLKGYLVLARAAFDAVKQWRYRPYAPNGKPVDFQTYVTINFKIPGQST